MATATIERYASGATPGQCAGRCTVDAAGLGAPNDNEQPAVIASLGDHYQAFDGELDSAKRAGRTDIKPLWCGRRVQ